MLDAVSAAVVLADGEGRVIRMNSYAHKVFRGRPALLTEVGLEPVAGEQTVRRMDASTVTASVAVTCIDEGLRVLTVAEWHGHHEYARLDLNAFGVGTWDWHIPSGDLHFDRRWLEMLGYAQGELEYDLEAWERLVHPDDRQRVDEALRAHLAGRSDTYRCEYRCRHHDGPGTTCGSSTQAPSSSATPAAGLCGPAGSTSMSATVSGRRQNVRD
jgi:PAS domain-containing protein